MQVTNLCHSRLFAEVSSRQAMISEAALTARKYKHNKEKQYEEINHHNYFDQRKHHSYSSSFRKMSNLSEYSKEQYISAFVEAHSAAMMHRNLLRQLRESPSTFTYSFPSSLSSLAAQSEDFKGSWFPSLQELHNIAEELKLVYQPKEAGRAHDEHQNNINNHHYYNNNWQKRKSKLTDTAEATQGKSKEKELQSITKNKRCHGGSNTMLILMKENNNYSSISNSNWNSLVELRKHTSDSTVPFGAWHETNPDVASHYTAIDKRVHVIIREACTPHYLSPECIQRTLAPFANQLHLHALTARIDTLWTKMKHNNEHRKYRFACSSNNNNINKNGENTNTMEGQFLKKQEAKVLPSEHLDQSCKSNYNTNTMDGNVRTEFTVNGVIENCRNGNTIDSFAKCAMCKECSIAIHNLYKELLRQMHWDNIFTRQQNKKTTLDNRYGSNIKEGEMLVEFDGETFQLRCNLCYHVIQILVSRYGWQVGMKFVLCEIEETKHTFTHNVEMQQMITEHYDAKRRVMIHIQVMVEVLCEAIRYVDYVLEQSPTKANLEELCTCAIDVITCIQGKISNNNNKNNKRKSEVEKLERFLHEEEFLKKECCKEELSKCCKLPLAAAPLLALIQPQICSINKKMADTIKNNKYVDKEDIELYDKKVDNSLEYTQKVQTDKQFYHCNGNVVKEEEEWSAEAVQHFAQRYLIATKTRKRNKCNNNIDSKKNNNLGKMEKVEPTKQTRECCECCNWMPANAWGEYIKAMYRCGATLSTLQKLLDDITDESITYHAEKLIQSVHIWNAYLYAAPASHALEVYKVNMPHYQVHESAATTASLIHALLHNSNSKILNKSETVESTSLESTMSKERYQSAYYYEEAHQLYKQLQTKAMSTMIVGTVSVFLAYIDLHKVQGHLKELLYLCLDFYNFYIFFGLRLEWWEQQRTKRINKLEQMHKQLFDTNYRNSIGYCANESVRNNELNVTDNHNDSINEESKELWSKYDIWFDEMQSVNNIDEKMYKKSNDLRKIPHAVLQTTHNNENEMYSNYICNKINAGTIHSFIDFFKRACQHCTHGMPPQIQHALSDAILHILHSNKTTNHRDNNNNYTDDNKEQDEYISAINSNNHLIGAEINLQNKQNNIASVTDNVEHQQIETSPVECQTNLHKVIHTNVKSSDNKVDEETGSISADMLEEMMSIMETYEEESPFLFNL